jgi:hypothetical protein
LLQDQCCLEIKNLSPRLREHALFNFSIAAGVDCFARAMRGSEFDTAWRRFYAKTSRNGKHLSPPAPPLLLLLLLHAAGVFLDRIASFAS